MRAFNCELFKLNRTIRGLRSGGGVRIAGGALAVCMELEFHIKESIEAGRIKVPLFDWILGIEDDIPKIDSSFDANSSVDSMK